MNERKPPIDESRARELLKRQRERIESSLADQERVRRSELDDIDTVHDLALYYDDVFARN